MKLLATLLRSAAPLVVLFSAASVNTFAQSQSTDLTQVSLEQLGDIQVYSASKHLQSAESAPSSVTVITADQIQENGYRTLADVLRTVRGFFVAYDRNYSSLGVRGFARPGDYNTRILLLVDGHRLNDNVYDGALIGTEFPIDVELIQRIEIVRGPASSLYGSNALFAVINIITRHGNEVDGLELSSEAASFNSYKGRVSYGRDLPQLKFMVSGSFYGSRGHKQLFYPEFNTAETNNGIASHDDDDQLGTALATISSHDFTLQGAYGTREKGIPTASYGTLFNTSGNRTTDSHGYVDLRYQHTVADSWDVLARVFYDRYSYQGTYLYPSSDDASQISPNLDYADGKWWGTELEVAKVVLNRNRITVGGEYRDNFRQDQSNYNHNPYLLILDDRRTSFVGALYLQDELTLTKSLALNAGFRYDYYSSINSSTDPRVALIYRPAPSTALKLLYGEAFRVPNVYERFYSIAPNLPNPALQPERIHSTEFVWEQELSRRFWLSSSAFHNTMDDLITQESASDDLLIFRNVQNVESNGLELELKSQLSHGLEAVASYSFQETKDQNTHRLLDNSPRTLAKFNLTQPLLGKTLFASVDAQYRSRIESQTEGSISPFSVVNATLLGRKIGKHGDLSASVYNLFDKRYSDPVSSENLQTSIPQDGRNFRVTMTWHLGER